MCAPTSQVASDAALARAFQEEEWRQGRAPKPPPLQPEYPPPRQEDKYSHFEDWSGLLQNQAKTLKEKVRKAELAHREGTKDEQLALHMQAQELGVAPMPAQPAVQQLPQQKKDEQLALHMQAQELGVASAQSAVQQSPQQGDLELARAVQAQELEAAQNSGAPVDWNVLEKLSPVASPRQSEGESKGPEALSGKDLTSRALEALVKKSDVTPVHSEVVPPDGFFDGIKTDPKIVPIISPEELEEVGSRSSRSTGGLTDEMDEVGPLEHFGSHEDGVGAKLRHMKSIPHILRTNSFMPKWDDPSASEDHALLVDRLAAYGLAERHVAGDGNCQFHSLSDQIYRTPDKHKHVRKVVIDQLKSHPEFYEAYVSDEDFRHYIKRMSKDGEWGDHITLQAAADRYGVKIGLLTTFKDNGFIQIEPRQMKSERVLYLSFWAEVHYNSIYPGDELPHPEAHKHRNAIQKFIDKVLD